MSEQDNREEDSSRDKEGLLLKYDVIVCGTGLVQSIVASALARAGKTVLHCDGADQYGELDAVWTYNYLQEEGLPTMSESASSNESKTMHDSTNGLWLAKNGSLASLRIHSTKQTTDFPVTEGSQVQTSYGPGTLEKTEQVNDLEKLTISMDNWKLADGKSPTLYHTTTKVPTFDHQDGQSQTNNQVQSKRSIQAKQFLSDPYSTRCLALDASPVLVLAAGRAVQGMLASGVAEYLEFKSLQGLFWLERDAKTNKEALWRVPCSKGDIFATKLLAPMDKRRLMKFLQLTMDFATSQSVQEEIESTTTTTSSNAVQDSNIDEGNFSAAEEQVQSLNERHLNQGRSLARPQNKAVATDELQKLQTLIAEDKLDLESYLAQQKLSPKLRALIRYALALETTPKSSSLLQGMNKLRHHLQSLGRYGTTAFLVPMYGSGELSQAFCRSAAVFGATYLLRREPFQIMLDDDAKCVRSVRIANDEIHGEANDGTTEKEIQCSHVIVCQQGLERGHEEQSTSRSTKRTLRSISILNGKVIQADDGDQRHALVIPPDTVGNEYAVHCILMDHSVQVAPSGCTIMHLTTTVNEVDGVVDETILEDARTMLLGLQNAGEVDEIYHLSFSFESGSADELAQITAVNNATSGLHYCSHLEQGLTADAAFEQAETIFRRICPGMEFLGLSEEMDNIVKERVGDRNGDDDDERTMLDSAVDMIGKSTTTNETAHAESADVQEKEDGEHADADKADTADAVVAS